jgi:hypothetical protein
MIAHLFAVATSCYPNCHPGGTVPSPVQESGNAALGAAALLVVILLLKSVLFSKGKGK